MVLLERFEFSRSTPQRPKNQAIHETRRLGFVPPVCHAYLHCHFHLVNVFVDRVSPCEPGSISDVPGVLWLDALLSWFSRCIRAFCRTRVTLIPKTHSRLPLMRVRKLP